MGTSSRNCQRGKLNPPEVARRLQVRGKPLPDELKVFSSFKLLTPDNLGELLAEEQNPSLDVWETEPPGDARQPIVEVPVPVCVPTNYPAGPDGYRRDRRIYELARNRFTNENIVLTIEKESPIQKWEPVVESTISDCIKRITQFDQLQMIVRKGGRPRAAKPKEPEEPQART